jgi:hypothetical protein
MCACVYVCAMGCSRYLEIGCAGDEAFHRMQHVYPTAVSSGAAKADMGVAGYVCMYSIEGTEEAWLMLVCSV